MMKKKDLTSEVVPYHKPVLVDEVIEYLHIIPNGVYVDATFGGGGHSRALLEHNSTCQVIGLDWDMGALEKNGLPLQEKFPERLQLIWGNFAQIVQKLKKIGVEEVDGILADFGTSQFQLTQGSGFSFHTDSVLDMRMSPAHQRITARHLLNELNQQELFKMFAELGQEPKARALAKIIVEMRTHKPFETTFDLVGAVNAAGIRSTRKHIHSATRAFQAVRMYVNKELENIELFLNASLRVLKPNGRLVCITFHSLEDRAVKQNFKEFRQSDTAIEILTPKPITPSEQEIFDNPSSRSAKLRAIKRGLFQ